MASNKQKQLVLCILDGLGIGSQTETIAVFQADTPNLDKLVSDYPTCKLQASGPAVGLPNNQPGNSEVGHLTIGSGRVIEQDLPRITKALTDNFLNKSNELADFIASLKKTGGAAHILGLLSDGGVHSHIDHICIFTKHLIQHDIPVYIHITTDGRDTAQNSGASYLSILKKNCPIKATIATVIGRYFSMDRDHRWERTQIAYDLIKYGKAKHYCSTPEQAIRDAYKRGETDEFIKSTSIANYRGLAPCDGIFMANFRVDRVRQIMSSFYTPEETDIQTYDEFKPSIGLAMTPLSDTLNNKIPYLFAPTNLSNGLGETISNSGMTQLRLAETEKYPHVTFFFNGGVEKAFEGELRELIASPKVATYDLQPEMSAKFLLKSAIKAIKNHSVDVIIVNFANPDMVGHTGDLKAAITAVETVDKCVKSLIENIEENNGVLIVTADHGNCDIMWDEIKKIPHTAHTTNLVSFSIVGASVDNLSDGTLADIAPTMLDLLNIKKPNEMSGISLINKPI